MYFRIYLSLLEKHMFKRSKKSILGTLILIVYLSSYLFSALGYISWDTVNAANENQNTSRELVAILVEKKLYPSIKSNLDRYTTNYIQKQHPNSQGIIIQIDANEYTPVEITKLLENIYFDGIKDKSSRLIGLVLFGNIPLPVVKYEDYIFPSIYPYVDFLEQKYIRDEEQKYFIKNKNTGEAEVRHGIINFNSISEYGQFFEKLKEYDKDPTKFVEKKVRYDDFLALKKNFQEDIYTLYQNKILFAEDLMYHRYTNFLLNILH